MILPLFGRRKCKVVVVEVAVVVRVSSACIVNTRSTFCSDDSCHPILSYGQRRSYTLVCLFLLLVVVIVLAQHQVVVHPRRHFAHLVKGRSIPRGQVYLFVYKLLVFPKQLTQLSSQCFQLSEAPYSKGSKDLFDQYRRSYSLVYVAMMLTTRLQSPSSSQTLRWTPAARREMLRGRWEWRASQSYLCISFHAHRPLSPKKSRFTTNKPTSASYSICA